MKMGELLEEKRKAEYKEMLWTIRCAVDGLLIIAKKSATYDEFVTNLQLLLDTIDDKLTKA